MSDWNIKIAEWASSKQGWNMVSSNAAVDLPNSTELGYNHGYTTGPSHIDETRERQGEGTYTVETPLTKPRTEHSLRQHLNINVPQPSLPRFESSYPPCYLIFTRDMKAGVVLSFKKLGVLQLVYEQQDPPT
jgi:hypothetical protein